MRLRLQQQILSPKHGKKNEKNTENAAEERGPQSGLTEEKFTPAGEGGSGLKASATEEKLGILIGLALKLVSLCNHNLLGLKRLNEDVWVISFVLA